MKKLGISKVMLSTLITGGALFGASATMANAPAPSNREGDTEIDLPPSAFVYSSLEDKKELVQEMKTEAQKIQFEREELARKLEEERIRIQKEKEEQRLKKIAEAEAAKKKKEEELRKAKVESEGQTFELTFYTIGYESTGKKQGDNGYGLTASGKKAKVGRTVACPKNIPFNTVIHIEGFGERVCEDRGSAIKNGKLDVLVGSVDEAYKLGRKKAKVRIIKK